VIEIERVAEIGDRWIGLDLSSIGFMKKTEKARLEQSHSMSLVFKVLLQLLYLSGDKRISGKGSFQFYAFFRFTTLLIEYPMPKQSG
jgi:hypothetical protein